MICVQPNSVADTIVNCLGSAIWSCFLSGPGNRQATANTIGGAAWRYPSPGLPAWPA